MKIQRTKQIQDLRKIREADPDSPSLIPTVAEVAGGLLWAMGLFAVYSFGLVIWNMFHDSVQEIQNLSQSVIAEISELANEKTDGTKKEASAPLANSDIHRVFEKKDLEQSSRLERLEELAKKLGSGITGSSAQ